MLRFLIRRLIQAGLTIFGVMLLTFVLFNLAAGDVSAEYVGPQQGAAARHDSLARHGLDRPWYEQFASHLKNSVTFQGESYQTGESLTSIIAARAVEAIKGHKRFGFNYDPSHFGYQGVDYIGFIREFHDRIHHVHMKDAYWSPTRTRAGVFGGHLDFGNQNRFWEFRSLGRGSIDFEAIERALNEIRYDGPLSVEWEDTNMDREFGATEACAFVKKLDFPKSGIVFDAQFDQK